MRRPWCSVRTASLAGRGEPGHRFRWASLTKLATALDRVDRHGARPSRSRRAGRSARGDRPPPARARVGAPVRRHGQPRRARDAADLLEPRVRRPWRARRGADGPSVRGGAPRVRPRRRSGWTRRSSSSGRRRASTGRSATWPHSPASCFGRRLVAPETARAATTVAFPGLVGVVPGVGRFDPCDWGLGPELHDGKAPHWMGPTNSAATFGHFGGAGTFVWIDPVADVGLGDAHRPRLRAVGARGVAGVLGFGARGDRRGRGALACRSGGQHMEIGPGIRRLGKGLVNSYLVETGGEVTIVDAGAPSYWGDLPRELAAMGRTLDDVRAVVLTHGHSDHIGFAERIRRERHTPILVHELDAALARGEVPNPAEGSRDRSRSRRCSSSSSSRRPTGCCASRGSRRSRRSVTARPWTCPVRLASSWCPATRPAARRSIFPAATRCSSATRSRRTA